jgi:hypothetical protein
LSNLVNTSLTIGKFPDRLKQAQVIPIYKKKATENYRPVSILPFTSKIYEETIATQLSNHVKLVFHSYLAAFRPGYGCHTTLVRRVEDWRRALGENKCAAAVLMDLSKAFDCLPHGLLTEKLRAYGIVNQSVPLITDRTQHVNYVYGAVSGNPFTKAFHRGQY